MSDERSEDDAGLRPGERAVSLPSSPDAGVFFIGVIRTPWTLPAECPKRGSSDGPICSIVVDERWRPALTGLAEHRRLQVLYWMHRARRDLVLQLPLRTQRSLCRLARQFDGARDRPGLRQGERQSVPRLCRWLGWRRQPDQGQAAVFISANPKVNAALMGAENGDWVSWYVTFAQSPLVIGYNPSSRFAAEFKSKPWYQVLLEPGIRIGRTDPKLDPKGGLTLALMKDAASFYKIPDLSQRVLGAPDNPAQVLPEETLVGRLQSGQLDVGFFYSTETSDAKIPALALPAEIAPKAVYTVTILRAAPNPDGADRFVAFFLGAEGQKLLKAHGLTLQPLTLTGAEGGVPPNIQSLLAKAK